MKSFTTYLITLAFTYVLTSGLGAPSVQIANSNYNRQTDSIELVKFFNDMDGQNWDSTWNLNMPMTTWYGVTLMNDRVSSIRLIDNNLSGQFKGFSLSNLTILQLGNDSIYGELMDYEDMPMLNELWLQNLQLKGGIPDFSNLKSLLSLNLSGNNLTGSIPDFSGLPNLGILSLSGNELTDSIPNFTKLPELILLNLSSNNLTGGIPDFNQLLSLSVLILSSNNIEGPFPTLRNLENLGHLDISFNPIGGAIPNYARIGRLNVLLVEGCQLTGEIPVYPQLGCSLSELNCANNQLTGAIPEFKNCQDLRYFHCNDNQLSGPLPSFGHLNRLSRLNCSNNRLTGRIPSFSQNSWLEYLDCSSNFLSGTIPDFQNSHRLEYFNCDNNVLIEGCIPDFSNIPDLEYAYFNNIDVSCIIPDFSDNINYKREFQLKLNKLTFEHLLPNYAANASRGDFSISPQDSIGEDTIIVLDEGNQWTMNLFLDDTVSTSTYYWFKDDQPYDTIVGVNELVINHVQQSDEGTYRVEISNSIITDLTLYSRNIELVVEGSTKTVDQVGSAIEVYPTPTENQLFIKSDEVTATWTIFSLYGTESLRGQEKEIDVSNLPAGSYVIEVIVAGQPFRKPFVKR